MTRNISYEHTTNKIHPLKFALWIGMASITMMFAAFTSAYIVRQSAGNWLEFDLPNIFFVSTLVLLISSVTLHTSYKFFVRGSEQRYKLFLILSFILGIAFLILQYRGWLDLFSIGIDLKGNPSGSFIYVLTGVHALHVIGGLAALTVGVLLAYSRPFRVTERRKVNFDLTLQYWHFVDLLWVYLLIFLYISR
jgi:Heme/copper-type cytochrome/quinol oxidase, subunit 3